MKATIGIMAAALFGLGLTMAVADDGVTSTEPRIVVSDIGDRTLLMAARVADEPQEAKAARVQPQEAPRTVRMVGPSFFPDE